MEFKIECIRKYRNGETLPDPGGCKRKTFEETVRRWIRIHERLGEAGLSHTKPCLTPDEIVGLMERIEGGESATAVADSVGRQRDLLAKWYRIYCEKGRSGIESLRRGRPGKMDQNNGTAAAEQTPEELIAELKARVRRLELENEYLKKLNALAQQRRERERKRRRPPSTS